MRPTARSRIPPSPREPVIEGLDELVGTRDQEEVEIRGTLAYDRLVASAESVRLQAVERFGQDVELGPGQELIADATTVTIGAATREGDALVVAVTVTGRSAAHIERDDVIEIAVGRTPDEAAAALAELGRATVELWPGWVGTVPDSDWRISVETVVDDAPGETGS